ncbi:hypothetical protein G4B88_026701, partial [Cannabis sativa]
SGGGSSSPRRRKAIAKTFNLLGLLRFQTTMMNNIQPRLPWFRVSLLRAFSTTILWAGCCSISGFCSHDNGDDLFGDPTLIEKSHTKCIKNEKRKICYSSSKASTEATSTIYVPTSFCNTCLRSEIGFLLGCCGGKRGGAVKLPNCITRFELYPFYSSITATPVPPPATKEKGKVWEEISGGDTFQFCLEKIKTVTNNFSNENKIGRGGFGEVYKFLYHKILFSGYPP